MEKQYTIFVLFVPIFCDIGALALSFLDEMFAIDFRWIFVVAAPASELNGCFSVPNYFLVIQ